MANIGQSEVLRVSAGETFFPFRDKPVVHPDRYYVNLYSFNVQVKLPFGSGARFLEFVCRLGGPFSLRGLEIVPNHPELSYLVDADDHNLDKRLAKLNKSVKTRRESTTEKLLDLTVGTCPPQWVEAGFMIDDDEAGDLHYLDGFKEFITGLRCCVESASKTYISRGNGIFSSVRPDCYDFLMFYPRKTGPLAKDNSVLNVTTYIKEDDSFGVGDGHPLYFKNQQDEIANIGVSIY